MTSVGANYDETQAASSKGDFIHKIKIALKEARESNYWLRMLVGLNYNSDELQLLIQESKELKNILGAIVLKLNHRIVNLFPFTFPPFSFLNYDKTKSNDGRRDAAGDHPLITRYGGFGYFRCY